MSNETATATIMNVSSQHVEDVPDTEQDQTATAAASDSQSVSIDSTESSIASVGEPDTFSGESGDWSSTSSSDHHHVSSLPLPITTQRRRAAPALALLSQADIDIVMQLDQHFDHALEERDISYSARYRSVRQSALFSIIFMLIFLSLGTVFFLRQADWTVGEALLFGVYTITTVGYGHLEHPETPSFQLYVVFYVFIGIACLTIMVAQVYQCLALEAARAEHDRDIGELGRQQGIFLTRDQVQRPDAVTNTNNNTMPSNEVVLNRTVTWTERLLQWVMRARAFFRDNEYGRGVSVIFPFLGLILAGSLVVGPIEGWTLVESLYFSVISLTTAGYGDYYPTRTASIWYCVLWLPFSIGFMSLFLGNVAAFYIRLSDKNISRIELQLRRRLLRIKERQEKERREARRRALRGQEHVNAGGKETGVELGTVIDATDLSARKGRRRRRGFDTVPTEEQHERESNDNMSQGTKSSIKTTLLFGSKENTGQNRRNMIIKNSSARAAPNVENESASSDTDETRPQAATMATMRDVISAVRSNIQREETDGVSFRVSQGPESEFFSMRSRKMVRRSIHDRTSVLRPSFALRALVQERFSEIIATEIAGYASSIEIHDNSLIVTIDLLKHIADKYMIPRRARKPFRSVCFEALFFVGEHGLITRGADALFDLTPLEFHSLFAQLLAAMGDAETMAGWLASTQVLADIELRQTQRAGDDDADHVGEGGPCED